MQKRKDLKYSIASKRGMNITFGFNVRQIVDTRIYPSVCNAYRKKYFSSFNIVYFGLKIDNLKCSSITHFVLIKEVLERKTLENILI